MDVTIPLCIVVSENQSNKDQSGNETCATFFEGIARFARFVWENATHDNILAFGTIAIAAFTFTLWRSTRRLWDAGERQLKHFSDTAERQLRAYVFVDVAHITHIQDGDGIPEGYVFIKNFGQTPAYEVVGVSGFAISTFPPPPNLNLIIGDDELVLAKTKSVLGPGQRDLAIASPRPQLTQPLSQQERTELANGLRTIYIYGKIRYRDVFGNIQWTSYRFMVGGPVGIRGDRLAGCEEGNEAT